MARGSTRRPEKADPVLRTWLVLIGAAQNRRSIQEQTLAERGGRRAGRALDGALARVAHVRRREPAHEARAHLRAAGEGGIRLDGAVDDLIGAARSLRTRESGDVC